ncbi:alanine dehydrogenase, partial [Agrococcus lahaulensis]
MRIAVPTEIKPHEQRVAITPAGVDALVRRGHEVWVQSGAGLGSRIPDEEFVAAGARLAADADEAWAKGDLLLKVKEPIAPEFARMREGQTVFTYLHLAAAPECARALLDAGTTAIAYETVQLPDGSLPLLAPMSEVAGRLSIAMGAFHLMGPAGGRGTLLGGVPGTRRAKVVVLGGGVAGEHAARNAVGLGADVTVIDLSLPRLRQLEASFGTSIQTRHSSRLEIAEQLADADLVIGSVLIPGAAAPKLVTDDMVRAMRPGSVLVDIAIDQG